MNNPVIKAHWSFWLIMIIALLFNIMGVLNFLAQLSPQVVASMPASHQAIIDGRPAWATIGFAFAVFGGTLGCLLLLVKKASAFYFFIASLAGVILAQIPNFRFVGHIISDPFEIIMMIASPFVLAIFLIWYATFTKNRGWAN